MIKDTSRNVQIYGVGWLFLEKLTYYTSNFPTNSFNIYFCSHNGHIPLYIIIIIKCSAQGQVLQCKRRNQVCSSAKAGLPPRTQEPRLPLKTQEPRLHFCIKAGLLLQTQEPSLQFCPKAGLPLQTQEPRLRCAEGRSSTANSEAKASVLAGMNRCGSLPFLSTIYSLFSI